MPKNKNSQVVEIDQSWRLENTNKATAIGFSNGKSGSILIPAKVKKAIYEILNEKYQRGNRNNLRFFGSIILLIIKLYKLEKCHFSIDEEYSNCDRILIDIIVDKGRKKYNLDLKREQFLVINIGKKSKAHFVAYNTFKQKRRPDKILKVKDILGVLF